MGLVPIFAVSILFALSSAANDDIYILIYDGNIIKCGGTPHSLDIKLSDVAIRDEAGRTARYIKAPGEYSIHFRKIRVTKNLGYLVGEISAILQVPVFTGPAGIHFDLPYQAIPETGILSQRCDENSGIVSGSNGRTYCRYCDLCGALSDAEKTLTSGRHKYLASGQEQAKLSSGVCSQADDGTYEIRSAVKLPPRSELESQIRTDFEGLDGELKKRLKKGRGRLQVFLNLLTVGETPMSRDEFFSRSPNCRCCQQESNPGFSCRLLGFFYCNLEECKAQHARQCMRSTPETVACFVTEFNYEVTDSYADVERFLAEHP